MEIYCNSLATEGEFLCLFLTTLKMCFACRKKLWGPKQLMQSHELKSIEWVEIHWLLIQCNLSKPNTSENQTTSVNTGHFILSHYFFCITINLCILAVPQNLIKCFGPSGGWSGEVSEGGAADEVNYKYFLLGYVKLMAWKVIPNANLHKKWY